MAKKPPSASRLVVVNTNVLLDLANDEEPVWQAIEVIRGRGAGAYLGVTPTVIQELVLLASNNEDTAPKQQAAAKALASLLAWDVVPQTLAAVEHGICDEIARRLIRAGLIPATERNDALVIAEAAKKAAMILITSDGHILDADWEKVRAVLKSLDVEMPVRASPWQVAKLFRGR